MQTQRISRKREVYSCLSPVEIWQTLLTQLFSQHYGLALNDTPLSDDTVIQQHIDAGISLRDAVNFIVEKYDLQRIDRKAHGWQEVSPYLRAVDILRARQATGLLKNCRALTA